MFGVSYIAKREVPQSAYSMYFHALPKNITLNLSPIGINIKVATTKSEITSILLRNPTVQIMHLTLKNIMKIYFSEKEVTNNLRYKCVLFCCCRFLHWKQRFPLDKPTNLQKEGYSSCNLIFL